MTNSTAQSAQRRSGGRRNWLLITLGALLILALIVGVSAIAGYFLLSKQAAGDWTWQDPLLALDVTRVRPDIAVLTLLDEPASSLIRQALAAGEPDTAYALLVYDAAVDDTERSGNALLVGKAFEGELATDLAATAYQQVQTLAALSPVMPDFTRTQSTLDAAEGFIRLGMPESAQPLLRQVEALARYSPLLAPIQRQEAATRLRDIYRQLGDDAQARALDQLVREPRGLPTNKFVRGPFLERFTAPAAPTDEVLQAAAARREGVYPFLAAWDDGDPAQIEAARQSLAAALLNENSAREGAMLLGTAEATALPQQAAILREWIDWLTLKYYIASDGFGMTLVPEWQAQRDAIWGKLGEAYGELLQNYRDQAAALPDPDDGLAARVEVLRYQALLGRLGLLPGFDESSMAAALRTAQEDALQVLPLLVTDEPWGSGLVFRITETFE
ncbi:MAG: hypothetical protein KDI07_07165 [Anaerolineae bacterium]|nr:hypothetical protein [Anaerolineae bacterium]